MTDEEIVAAAQRGEPVVDELERRLGVWSPPPMAAEIAELFEVPLALAYGEPRG